MSAWKRQVETASGKHWLLKHKSRFWHDILNVTETEFYGILQIKKNPEESILFINHELITTQPWK